MVMQRKRKQARPILPVFLIWLAGLWSTTQFFAWRMHYQEALGPNIEHVYLPWSCLQWAWAWWHDHSGWFMEAGSAGILVSASLTLILLLSRSFARRGAVANDLMHGSARWATRKDIEKAGLLDKEGVYVGGWQDPKTGKQHYLRHNGSEHLLCLAPTRSGKGICLVIPTLLSWLSSCVITDLKGELWALTSGWRKKHAGNMVLRFEPADEGSIAWNPMDEIRLGTAYEIGDVQNLATMIVDPEGKGLKDHWQKTAQALLVGCILHLLYRKANGETTLASLAAVDAMLADPAKPTSILWEEMTTNQHLSGKPHAVVAQTGQDMIERPDDERGSVLSTAKSYLALFRDPVVARNTNCSGFAIKDLMNIKDQPVSLYIVTQPVDKVRLRPLVRILINMICRVLAEKMTFVDMEPQKLSGKEKFLRILRGQPITSASGGRRAKGNYRHRLLMMLDEFPSMGKLEIVQESLAFLAGYGIRFYIICQDFAQLQNAEIGYGREEAITSNCHITNAFQPLKLDTAQHLSKLTGQTTIVKEQITESGKRLGMLSSVSRAMQEVSRPLMTEDEVMRMPPAIKKKEQVISGGDMLVFVAGIPAIYGKQMPYFLDPVFQARSSVNPPEESDVIPGRTVREKVVELQQ